MEKGMKVLYVTHYGDMYGANISMLNMILRLRETFNIVPMVLVTENGNLIKELKKYNIEYIVYKFYMCTVGMDEKFLKIKKMRKRILRFILYPFILSELRKRGMEFDMIHSNTSVTDLGYYLSRRFKVPHIWHIREYGKEDYNLVQIDNSKKIRERYEKSDAIIAISESIKEMIKQYGDNIRIRRINNGIWIPKAYEKIYKYNNIVNFCVIGLISKNKNQYEVVKAAHSLVKENVINFCVYIVGGGIDEEQEKIEKYIHKYRLDNYVKLEGYIENIQEYLIDKDVGLVLSYKEAFGRVTIEFMSNYMPVIGTKTGGTKEIIENDKNGYFYELGNSESLALQMKKFINDKDLMKKMGKQARKVSEKYSVENNAQEVYELYKLLKYQGVNDEQ